MSSLPGVNGFNIMYHLGSAAVVDGVSVDYVYVKEGDEEVYAGAGWVLSPSDLSQ